MSTRTEIMNTETKGVVGSGSMGRGISKNCFRSGMKAVLNDTSGNALRATRKHTDPAQQRSVDRNQATFQEGEIWLYALDTFEDVSQLSGFDLRPLKTAVRAEHGVGVLKCKLCERNQEGRLCATGWVVVEIPLNTTGERQ
jgi:hypothetical protein